MMVKKLDRKKVLVTGGAGYIGSTLVRHLLVRGYDVVVLDNLLHGGHGVLCFLGYPGYQFIKGDIRDVSSVTKAVKGVDYVVHLAAIVGDPACKKYPEEAKIINLDGTKIVFNVAKNNGVKRFVFFSTCSSYGVQQSDDLADENAPLNPVSLYAETKIEMEKYIIDNVDNNMCYTIMRPSTVYGASPRMRFDLIVNHFVKDSVLNKKLIIFGRSLWRPLMWVGDAARAVEIVLRVEKSLVENQIFNMGNTKGNHKKSEIGEIIKNKYIPDLTLEFKGTDQDLRSYRVDFSKIESKLGFKLIKTLEASICELIQLVSENILNDISNTKYGNV